MVLTGVVKRKRFLLRAEIAKTIGSAFERFLDPVFWIVCNVNFDVGRQPGLIITEDANLSPTSKGGARKDAGLDIKNFSNVDIGATYGVTVAVDIFYPSLQGYYMLAVLAEINVNSSL